MRGRPGLSSPHNLRLVTIRLRNTDQPVIPKKYPHSSRRASRYRATRTRGGETVRDFFGTARRVFALMALVPMALVAPLAAHAAGGYQQVNLASDIPNLARQTNPILTNPWGITFAPDGPFWISDNGSGFASVLRGNGKPLPNPPSPTSPLVVTIPPPAGATFTAAPTGVVFNGTSGFVVSQAGKSGPASLIFATEDGTISGWNRNVDPTHAILAVDRSAVGPGAVYKGLAIGSHNQRNFIYATNFRFGTVEMFDEEFHLITSFTDPTLANDCPLSGQCFAPFGIRNIEGKLFVTYALQKPGKHDDQEGPGNGFVDVFSTAVTLLGRFASQGTLNSPWGLALAPADFGPFSNDILVGNFGDGRINAYRQLGGEFSFHGKLRDSNDAPITIDGLWALRFGSGAPPPTNNGPANVLFFPA